MALSRGRAKLAAVCCVAIGGALAAPCAGAQTGMRRVPVGVSFGSPGTPAADSAALAAAFVRGLLADSLVELVIRPLPPGQPLRAMRVLLNVRGEFKDPVIRFDLRAFDVNTSDISYRDSLWTFVPAAADSMHAAGRRAAMRISGRRP